MSVGLFVFQNAIIASISLDTDQSQHFGLYWVQTVCMCYQQTTPADRELNSILFI